MSGQNVALVAGSALLLAWLLGLPRLVGELAALGAIGAYVLAVGAQPSVIRAAVAGALGSLAWIAARQKDRWHFLLLGAIVLLGWNPYALLDPGFELSFAAVGAIFSVAPRIRRVLDGYPVPRPLADVVSCGRRLARARGRASIVCEKRRFSPFVVRIRAFRFCRLPALLRRREGGVGGECAGRVVRVTGLHDAPASLCMRAAVLSCGHLLHWRRRSRLASEPAV